MGLEYIYHPPGRPSAKAMVALGVTCHRCHQEFPSGFSLDRKGERSRPIEGVVYECPRCQGRDTYATAEQHAMGTVETPAALGQGTWAGRAALPLPLSFLPLSSGSRAEVEHEETRSAPSRPQLVFLGGLLLGALAVVLTLAAFHGLSPGELVLLPW